MATDALFWGLVANASLLLGGVLGLSITFSRRTLGIIMAFGAGTLISAVSYELILDAVKLSAGTGVTGFGFLFGAAVFFLCDQLIEKIGAGNRKSIDATQSSSLVVPLVLAIILDGIPESTVIGLSILEGDTVSMAMLVAVFISNLPESIASTTGMKAGAWSAKKILLLWLLIGVVCALASVAGFVLLAGVSVLWLALIKAFAAGAILMMLANTMMPEAYAHGGKLAGVFTVLGFAVSVGMVLLERG
jgi:ZIP family zinc transporter